GTCLMAIGVRLLVESGPSEADSAWWLTAFTLTMEGISILAGVEWGRRIGKTASGLAAKTANGLSRFSQIITLVYVGLSLGYLAIFPEQAMSDEDGVFRTRATEVAVFVPVLGSAMLLSAIAIIILISTRIDRAEVPRLRALFFAAPFLLAALVLNNQWVPVTIALGLLIFISGSVRYLVIQSRRGQFMRQFLSPEVARMVNTEGLERTLQRERRVLSVVTCDLCGFTQFARTHDSNVVVSLLEDYYNIVGKIAARHGGTVKDHAGDGVLILVGAPLEIEDHARRAGLLALELMQEGQALLKASAGELGLSIGIATGHTTVGAIRGAGRLEYVAVGNPVNLAARLCDRAENGEILADQRTAEALVADDSVYVSQRPPEPLKGFPEPIPVCAITAEHIPQIEDRSKRRRRRRLRSRKSRQRASQTLTKAP
ncbi:MAG: adenylate/guanylate cyclase domain-containing protein, partial [Salinisphaeraceae bacterium]|nr:adenylate/guanylate cyclase domain-containing protein [Salinisphaeraceae bacterium]